MSFQTLWTIQAFSPMVVYHLDFINVNLLVTPWCAKCSDISVTWLRHFPPSGISTVFLSRDSSLKSSSVVYCGIFLSPFWKVFSSFVHLQHLYMMQCADLMTQDFSYVRVSIEFMSWSSSYLQHQLNAWHIMCGQWML